MELVGLKPKYTEDGVLYFANKNFTSTDYYKNVWIVGVGIILAIAAFALITFWLHK